MQYRYSLKYTPTDSISTTQTTTHMLWDNNLSVAIDKDSDEWFYTRKLDGDINFVNDDYEWIMQQPFDGTFTLTIEESHDGGSNWYSYFEGTFSRTNLTIDEDNRRATLSGLTEDAYREIKNGKDEEYDLMKIIPDDSAKEVQGNVPPSLAMVDYSSNSITKSDMFCGSAGTASGYKTDKNDWSDTKDVRSDNSWLLAGVYGEARVRMKSGQTSEAEGLYVGTLQYRQTTDSGHTVRSIDGTLRNKNNCQLWVSVGVSSANNLYASMTIYGSNNIGVVSGILGPYSNPTGYYNPSLLLYDDFGNEPFDKVEIVLHYIRATLLTQSGGNADNVLDTGDYYKRMAAFDNSDNSLTILPSSRTVEQPNGHRLISGTGEQGTMPQYFAPPEDNAGWIPLAEENWTYGSMWYKVTPSVSNGLADPDKVGSFRWTRCWTLGTILDRLLRKITNNKVSFTENSTSSRFLYESPNPVAEHEPFTFLFTQKSNVMRPSTSGAGASRCVVRLNWFLEFLHNALNCYYWIEGNNDGTYSFRIEHIEYFRHGGRYSGDIPQVSDITTIYTRRNLFRNDSLVKRLSDSTNKYSYDADNMVEKYTFSWQGDGGSDDFKGNPMFFRAGWVEKDTNEDHQVDNIFADLDWLMLNAGSDTESSKNYDGLFAFAGYVAWGTTLWSENAAPSRRYLILSSGSRTTVNADLWVTIPSGSNVNFEVQSSSTYRVVATFQGTGKPQLITLNYSYSNSTIRLNFGSNFANVRIHRFHSRLGGNVYRTPNTINLLNTQTSLQNGVLSWPWLQNEYLHYDIPSQKWAIEHEDLDDVQSWHTDGTVKMIKKQEINVFPMPQKSTENAIMAITGLKTGLGIGIITNAKVNLSTRNAELTIIYDPTVINN